VCLTRHSLLNHSKLVKLHTLYVAEKPKLHV
jgi:hypothetical protein